MDLGNPLRGVLEVENIWNMYRKYNSTITRTPIWKCDCKDAEGTITGK
jgi:hypothetical protein